MRPLEEADAERVFAWVSDPVVRRNVGLRQEPSLERTRAWIASSAMSESLLARAITVDGEHVGNVVIDQVDSLAQTARLSIYLGWNRGRGIGQQAIQLCAKEAFSALPVRKIWLHVAVDNVAAIRCYMAAGFDTEGLLRQHFYTSSGVVDCYSMALFA